MANEKRLIDVNAEIRKMRDALAKNKRNMRHLVYWVFDAVISVLEKAPTVDAVEVVRCKNCRDCEMCYPEKRLDKEATQAWICNRYKERGRMTTLDEKVQNILDFSDFNDLPFEERKRICKYLDEKQILTIWQTLSRDKHLTTDAWRKKQRQWLANCVEQYRRNYMED